MLRELITGRGQDGGDALLPLLLEAWATGMTLHSWLTGQWGRWVLHAALLFLGAGAWLLVGLSLATLFCLRWFVSEQQ